MPFTPFQAPWQWVGNPLWFVPLFLAFWFGGAALMARMAGWRALADAFPPPPAAPAGTSMRFVSGSLGSKHWPIRYRNCLQLVIGEQGLYLRLMFPFHFRSPPFLVPWSAVEAVEQKQSLSTRTVTFRFRGQWSALTLQGPIGQAALAAHGAAMPAAVAA